MYFTTDIIRLGTPAAKVFAEVDKYPATKEKGKQRRPMP